MNNDFSFTFNKKSLDKEQQRRLSLYLKRKRLEQHKTQGEVADGICTVSYYSRIENNLAEVGEDFYNLLFNKLNVDYTSLMEERDVQIFDEVLKCHLCLDFKTALANITKALESRMYMDLEYDILLLYNNIIKGLYSEARLLLEDLKTKYSCLSEEEKIMYSFLSALYAYKTNQGLIAYEQIESLLISDISNDLVEDAVIDLALDIFMYIDNCAMFMKYYPYIKRNDFSTKYVNRAMIHLAQYNYFAYDKIENKTAIEISNIRTDISSELCDEINNIFIQNEYHFRDYITIHDCLEAIPINPRNLAYKALLCLKLDLNNIVLELKDERNTIKFGTHDKAYKDFIDIVLLIKTKYDYIVSLENLIDLVRYQIRICYDGFFLQEEINLLNSLSIRAGRYRDAAKMIELVSMEQERIKYKNL